jgi:hypothetical protein
MFRHLYPALPSGVRPSHRVGLRGKLTHMQDTRVRVEVSVLAGRGVSTRSAGGTPRPWGAATQLHITYYVVSESLFQSDTDERGILDAAGSLARRRLAAALLLLACSMRAASGDEVDAAGIELTTRNSGLRFYDEKRGPGESPVFGEIVHVHYVASWVNWDQPLTVASHSASSTLPLIPARRRSLTYSSPACPSRATTPPRTMQQRDGLSDLGRALSNPSADRRSER